MIDFSHYQPHNMSGLLPPMIRRSEERPICHRVGDLTARQKDVIRGLSKRYNTDFERLTKELAKLPFADLTVCLDFLTDKE